MEQADADQEGEEELEFRLSEDPNFWVDRDSLDSILLPIRDAIDGSQLRVDYLLQQVENIQYDQEQVQLQWE